MEAVRPLTSNASVFQPFYLHLPNPYLQIHSTHTHTYLRLTVTVYGWYGSDGPRINNGELTMSTRPSEVAYIPFSLDLRETLPAALANTHEFNRFDFSVTPKEGNEPPTTAAPPGDVSIFNGHTVWVICGTVLVALLIMLVIVVVCVFGRRRRNRPRSK